MSVMPEDLQGRALSASLLAASLVAPLAPLTGGFAVGWLTPAQLFLGLGAVEVLALLTLARPRTRTVLSSNPHPAPET